MTNLLTLWWTLALISGAGLATRNVLFKVANGKIEPAFGALVLSLAMSATTILYYASQRIASGQSFVPQAAAVNWQGVALAAISGAAVAGANIFLAYSYRAGGPASLVGLLQNGFSLTLTVLIGVAVLGEVIRPVQGLGIALAFAGMCCIVKG